MILDDSYKKQQARYEFAAKYCLGSTLDYSFSSIMSYHGSKILLNNGAREIFTHDISNKNEDFLYIAPPEIADKKCPTKPVAHFAEKITGNLVVDIFLEPFQLLLK